MSAYTRTWLAYTAVNQHTFTPDDNASGVRAESDGRGICYGFGVVVLEGSCSYAFRLEWCLNRAKHLYRDLAYEQYWKHSEYLFRVDFHVQFYFLREMCVLAG